MKNNLKSNLMKTNEPQSNQEMFQEFLRIQRAAHISIDNNLLNNLSKLLYYRAAIAKNLLRFGDTETENYKIVKTEFDYSEDLIKKLLTI
jgi:hypothetical protein